MMSDRYLFRGKQFNSGKWIIGYYSFLPKGNFCVHDRHLISWASVDKDGFEQELIDPTTLGQCTDLKDKNGKLIFEGDIVRCGYTEADGEEHSSDEPVAWRDCGWVLLYGDTYNILDNNDCGRYEVIGNIHDKPELLEVNNG